MGDVTTNDIMEMFRETDRRMRETDRKMQETAEQMRETDRRLGLLGREIGHLGNRLGEFVEALVRPSLIRLFREFGFDVAEVITGVYGTRDGVSAELDALVVDDDIVVAVEAKSKLTSQAVDEHILRLGRVRKVFHIIAGKRIHGALAAMVIPPESAAYAESRGLFVIGQKGDDAVLLNSNGFCPSAW